MDRWATRSVALNLAALALFALVALYRPPASKQMPAPLMIKQQNPAGPPKEIVVLPPPPAPAPPRGEARAPLPPYPEPQPGPATVPEAKIEQGYAASEPVAQADETESPPGLRERTSGTGSTAVDDREDAHAMEPLEATVDGKAVTEGRVILHLIAQGKGPDIQIAWPDEAGRRKRLYRLLTSCYGLQSAILLASGELYRHGGESGKAWEFNRDFYSSFLRTPKGRLPAEEKRLLATIEDHHAVRGQAVRILPRLVDAGIVGAIFQLADRGRGGNDAITARYGFDENGLLLLDMAVGGREVAGRIRVPKMKRVCN